MSRNALLRQSEKYLADIRAATKLSAAVWRSAKNGETRLRIDQITLRGAILIRLDHARAPATAGHFQDLVTGGHLNGASFYRAVHKNNTPGQLPTIDVLQGGRGFAPIEGAPSVAHEPTSETGLRHVEGVVSMARGKDAPASTEFFICLDAFPDRTRAASMGQAPPALPHSDWLNQGWTSSAPSINCPQRRPRRKGGSFCKANS